MIPVPHFDRWLGDTPWNLKGRCDDFRYPSFMNLKKKQLKLGTGPFWAAFLRHDCRFFVCQCVGK